jgi:hypothetical protein
LYILVFHVFGQPRRLLSSWSLSGWGRERTTTVF